MFSFCWRLLRNAGGEEADKKKLQSATLQGESENMPSIEPALTLAMPTTMKMILPSHMEFEVEYLAQEKMTRESLRRGEVQF